MENALNIYTQLDNPTLAYGAQELKKYLELMCGLQATVIPAAEKEEKPARPAKAKEITLGLFGELALPVLSAADKSLDDEIYIDIKAGEGIIAGINPRSVLIAIYRMLSVNGCVWARPGKDGEYIPQKDISALAAAVQEKASYRHRGIDFIGEKNREDVLDLLEWMPKLAFNSVFFEGLYPYKNFYNFQFHLTDDTASERASTEAEDKKNFWEAIAKIQELDLIYHSAGHGFNCEPIGLESAHRQTIDEDKRPLLALVDGKRELQSNACATNLCYSNPTTVELLVDFIVKYVKTNDFIDYVHVWLADAANSNCECPDCKDQLVSDIYIKVLNKIDEALTALDNDTRLVLISYTDLIWKPEKEQLNNPARFTLTHAPHYRTYRKSFLELGQLPDHIPYEFNNNVFPVSIEDNIYFFNEWNEYFTGDNFIFEYHFWKAQYEDPGLHHLTRVLYEDIQALKDLGINGYIGCQQVKSCLPTGLGIYVMGKALWDSSLAYEDLEKEYYAAAFGKNWAQAANYLRQLSDLFDPDIFDEKGPLKKDDFARYSKAIRLIEDFELVIEQNIKETTGCSLLSWQYLKTHAWITILRALAFENKALGNFTEAATIWRFLERFVVEHQDTVKRVFDVYTFNHTQKDRFVSAGN